MSDSYTEKYRQLSWLRENIKRNLKRERGCSRIFYCLNIICVAKLFFLKNKLVDFMYCQVYLIYNSCLKVNSFCRRILCHSFLYIKKYTANTTDSILLCKNNFHKIERSFLLFLRISLRVTERVFLVSLI